MDPFEWEKRGQNGLEQNVGFTAHTFLCKRKLSNKRGSEEKRKRSGGVQRQWLSKNCTQGQMNPLATFILLSAFRTSKLTVSNRGVSGRFLTYIPGSSIWNKSRFEVSLSLSLSLKKKIMMTMMMILKGGSVGKSMKNSPTRRWYQLIDSNKFIS